MEKIGKYQIIGELGTGGFGTVYKATDPSMGREVAIKVLKAQDDAGMVKRFQAEARTAANLRHRNIVTVFEFGEENGMQFLVMEYLDGTTLRDLIVERAPLSPVEKLNIMSEAALGLKAAHESGILHRDVKPANIMRLSDGSVKIMDFGISRPMGDVDTRLTQAGFLMGTPQYMAPEQFTSDNDADVLCDIWAYGVVLYEFLTLTNPFHASKPAQIIYRLTAEEPRPLSDFLPDIPERLEAVVRRLLSKSRDRRYQTIEDARFDLQPVLLEMRQTQVQALIATAEDLIRDRRLDEAQAMVRRVLDLDQSNAWARKWRGELREMLRAQSVQVRVRQLVEKADIELAASDDAAASEHLKEALKLDPANDGVRKRIEEIQAARARAERASRLLASAREEMNRKALTRALEHASQAAESDPKSPEAKQLVSEINQALEQRDLEALRKNALNSATRLVLLQAYDEAITVLKQFIAQAPGDRVIQERLEEVKRLYALHLEQQRVERAIADSKELLRRGNYQQAIAVLKPCERSSPQNSEIRQLLAYAAEQAEVEARIAQVREILDQGDARARSGEIDQALDLAGHALELAPDNDRAQQLRDNMLEARRRREEDREVERLAAKCRAGLASGAIDEAGALVTELANRFPGHAVVIDLKQQVERKIQERREAHEREIREHQQRIEQLLKAGKGDEATLILQSLTQRYPGQKQAFAPLLDRAAKVERDKREREMRQEAERAEQLLTAGKGDEATLILQSLTQRFPGKQQEFAPLFDRAAAIEREKRERQAIEAEVAEFRKISAGGHWEEALKAIEAGLEKRPDQPEFVEERDRVRRGMAAAKDKREREAVQAELAQIRKISGAGRWEEALAEVERRLAKRPDQPEFLEERDAVRRGMAAAREKRERKAIESAAAQMRALTTARRWEEALAEIERGLGERPNQPEFLEERDLARQGMAAARGQREQQEVASALAQIRQISAAGQWEAALTKLDEYLAKRPNQPEFLEERDAVRRGLAAARGQREREEVESAIAQIRQISGTGNWEGALAKIEEFLAKRPNLPEFLEERDRTRQGMAAARGQRERQEVAAAIAQVRQISGAGNWEEALAKIEEFLGKRPNLPEFLEERDRTREGMAAARGQREQQEVAAALAQVREIFGTGNWEAALAKLDECLARRPSQPEFLEARELARRGLATARDKREKQAIEAELAHFRQLGAAGKWEEALAELELGLVKRPNQPQFVEERERMRRRMACVQAVREVEQSLARGEFNPAIALAESAQRQYPEEPRIGVLLAAAREQRKLADDVGRAEGLLRRKEIDEANTLIAELLKRHGADSGVQRLKQSLDRVLRRRQNFAAVEQLRKRLDFKKALELAALLVKEDADDAAAHDLFEALSREQAEHERGQRVANGRAEALKLLNSRKYDAAQQSLARLAKEFPENGDIQDDLVRVQQARQEHEKKDAYTRGRSEVEAFLKQRRLEDAIAKLEALLRSYPDDPFLLQDLKSAQDTKALRDRAATVETEIRALEALFNKGDAQGVKDRASRLLEKYEEPRARELLNWATKTLSEVRGIRRKIDGTMRRAMWIGGIAAALVLAILIYLKWGPSPSPPVTELGVQPAELTFTYQRGGSLPRPGMLVIKGKPATQVWMAAATDAWFTVKPAELTGNGTVEVNVDPSKLPVDEYSGFATIKAKDGSVSPASIRIRMRVTDPKKEEIVPPPPKKEEKKEVIVPPPPKKEEKKEEKKEVIVPPPPPPKKEEKKEEKKEVIPTDPAVNCHATDYPGLPIGAFRWANGVLGPGESIIITRRKAVFGGGGRVTGAALPGCDVSLKVMDAGGLQISEPPQASNQFGRVTVKNGGSTPIGSFSIQWTVK